MNEWEKLCWWSGFLSVYASIYMSPCLFYFSNQDKATFKMLDNFYFCKTFQEFVNGKLSVDTHPIPFYFFKYKNNIFIHSHISASLSQPSTKKLGKGFVYYFVWMGNVRIIESKPRPAKKLLFEVTVLSTKNYIRRPCDCGTGGLPTII